MARIAVVSVTHLLVRARQAFWLIPACCVVAALLLAVGLPVIDAHNNESLLFPGGPESARSSLSSITTAMISLTGLVFSITIVALQLAAGQFSSRVMRDFLRDRVIQSTFGVFVGTFTYSMVLQRSIHGSSGGQNVIVPAVAVTTAFALVLTSVALFIVYINRIANSIRIANIVARIGSEVAAALSARYPSQLPHGPWERPTGVPDVTVRSARPGVIVSVNEEALVLCAERADSFIEVLPRVGDFVPFGAPVLAVFGGRRGSVDLLRHIGFDTERTYEQDPAFGIRELVDIAERALSPAVNDPTTAAQATDVIHDLLRRVAVTNGPICHHLDRHGTPRLVVPGYSFPDLLDLALAEIMHYGAHDVQTPGRLRVLLTDLQSIALVRYRPAIDRWLTVLENLDGAGT